MSVDFKNDRRSLRTRKAIKLAFFKLLKTKDIEEISITELTKLANVNRNSFYTHYKSVNSILEDINFGIFNEVDEILTKYTYKSFKENPKPLIYEFSKAIVENKYFSEYLLFSKNSVNLVNQLKMFICSKCVQAYERERGEISPFIPYMITFLVGGVFDMYCYWFTMEKQISLELITEKIVQFVSAGIKALQDLK